MNGYDVNPELICFLRDEIGVLPRGLVMAQRLCQETSGSLPVILWQYGLLTLEQLERTWEWLGS